LPIAISLIARNRMHYIRGFVINPATGASEITPKYRIIVTRTLRREARGMKLASYFCHFRLYINQIIVELRYLRLVA